MNRYIEAYRAETIETLSVENINDCKGYFEIGDLGFRILHVNIRSAAKNLQELIVLLNSTEVHFETIVLSECWNIDDTTVHNIQGYKLLYNESRLNKNDGVLVYIQDSLPYTYEVKLIDVTKAMQIEINYLGKIILLTAVYRLPSTSLETFLAHLGNFMENCKRQCDVNIFLGDLNINILNNDHNTQDYLTILSGQGFLSAINMPTRVQNETKSCIDHMFIRQSTESCKCIPLVIKTCLTDHYSIAAQIVFSKKQCEKPSNKFLVRKCLDKNKLLHLIKRKSGNQYTRLKLI